MLTTLLKPDETTGTLFINNDTDDITSVISRDRSAYGKTHMRIMNLWPETYTSRFFEELFNRIEIQ